MEIKGLACSAGRTGEGVGKLVYVAMVSFPDVTCFLLFLLSARLQVSRSCSAFEVYEDGELDYWKRLHGQYFRSLAILTA